MSTQTTPGLPESTDLPEPTVRAQSVSCRLFANVQFTQVEELYSSWSLFIVCVLLIMSLLLSYYLQIKRIRMIHETIISIFAGMVVGLVVRLSPGTLIREMLVSA